MEKLINAVSDKWHDSLSPDSLSDRVSGASVSVNLSDEMFEEKWTEEKIRLEGLSRPFLQSLDKAETECRVALESVGIRVSRDQSSDLALSQERPNLSWKWTTETVYERRWYTLWLYKHEKQVGVRKLDKSSSREELIDYAKDVASRLINHLNWWREKHIQSRYLASVTNAISDTSQADSVLAGWSKDDLSELTRVREELTQSECRITAYIGKKHRPSGTTPPVSVQGEPISANSACHFLEKLVRGYRELRFHRHLFRIIGSCESLSRHPILVAVSAEEDDLRRLIALMRHDLRNWQAIPVSPSGSIFHSHSR